jgi:hypothetical protein
MKTFDIIYVALICFVGAVFLWAYWEDIKDVIGNVKLNNGGGKKKKRRKVRRRTV